MDALFQSMNFNFTALGEMRLYATLRRMYKVNNKILLKRFKEDTSFRNQVSLRLGLVGKSVYPHFPINSHLLSVKNIYASTIITDYRFNLYML